jgi:hypothetical protein
LHFMGKRSYGMTQNKMVVLDTRRCQEERKQVARYQK